MKTGRGVPKQMGACEGGACRFVDIDVIQLVVTTVLFVGLRKRIRIKGH